MWKRAGTDGTRLRNCLQLGNHRSKLKSQTEHAARHLLQSRRNQRREQRYHSGTAATSAARKELPVGPHPFVIAAFAVSDNKLPEV